MRVIVVGRVAPRGPKGFSIWCSTCYLRHIELQSLGFQRELDEGTELDSFSPPPVMDPARRPLSEADIPGKGPRRLGGAFILQATWFSVISRWIVFKARWMENSSNSTSPNEIGDMSVSIVVQGRTRGKTRLTRVYAVHQWIGRGGLLKLTYGRVG